MDIISLQHSLFLGALGNAILNSLWQSFLLWIIYETIIISYKKTDAKIKHNLSVLFTFGSFIWFVITLISKLIISDNISTFVPLINNQENTSNGNISSFHEILTYAGNVLPYLSVGYIFLLLFLTAKLFIAYRHVHYIAHKNLFNPPAALNLFASQVSLQLGIPKKIKIWISNHIEVPATIGFLKPVILIPFASLNHLTVHQLEAVILHELSHIKRNDYFINLLISIIETILFFNPFIALFIKIIKSERENCCDDFVLQYRYDPHSYASALLRLEQSRKNNVQLALGAVSGKKQLLSRIKRITGTHTVNQFNYGQKLLALLITTGIICSLAWLSPSKVKKVIKNPSQLTVTNIVTQKYQFDNIPGKKEIEKNVNKIETEKTGKDHQIIKIQEEINTPEISEIPGTNSSAEKEKNKVIDKISGNDLKSSDPTQASELDQLNLKALIFKNIPKISIGNLNINLDKEINKGLIQAYKEINKIDWTKVQDNIKQSFSKIKIDQISEKERAEIAKAKSIISHLKIDNGQFNSIKILQEISRQQKLIADSIKAAGNTFIIQLPGRIVEEHKRNSLQNLNSSTNNFVFTPDNKLDFNILFNSKKSKTENKSEEASFESNGKKLKIDIQKVPSQAEPTKRNTNLKRTQHIIIEI
ncbi:MAG TPA: M56 family metallopeptidase [Hanamia sp.]